MTHTKPNRCLDCGTPVQKESLRCSPCARKSRRIVRVPKIRPTTEDRLWRKVNKDGPIPTHCPHLGNCWEWTGNKGGSGYGMIWFEGRSRPSHRICWQLIYGPIPEGLIICHHCDNRLCVRPDHLFIGTIADNNADMMEKGRYARGLQSGAHTHPERVARGLRAGVHTKPETRARGERHGRSKFTEAIVIEIRRLYAGGESQRSISNRLGVSQPAISTIVRGIHWTHVPMPDSVAEPTDERLSV